MVRRALLAALIGTGLAACAGNQSEDASMSVQTDVAGAMTLRSDTISPGQPIPRRHTCDGEDVSPPLAWDGAPPDTQAFAVLVEDPDARGFVHWALVDIPSDVTSLSEGQGDQVGTPGRNGFGRIGWGGPCPPSGEHRYVFTIFALGELLQLGPAPDAAAVREALDEASVLDTATFTAPYRRGG